MWCGEKEKKIRGEEEKSSGKFCRFQKKLYLCIAIQGNGNNGVSKEIQKLQKRATDVGEVAELVDALL